MTDGRPGITVENESDDPDNLGHLVTFWWVKWISSFAS